MIDCKCLLIDAEAHGDSLVEFDAIRMVCPALSKILVPDDCWSDYRQFCESEPDKAFHAPIAYLAFQRRHLAGITAPIHAYCLDGGELHSALTKQYKKDLADRWMFKEDLKQRFKRTRVLQGRLNELLFAQWLEGESWNIEGLEAHGANVDAVASSTEGTLCSFEVKHIGQDELSFDLDVEALQGNGVSFGRLPVYSPVDYMLYRVFEAARQLADEHNRKVVVMILSNFDRSYKLPIKEGWIDWKVPKFLRMDEDIDEFLEGKYIENPSLNDDLKKYISQLDEIWFFDNHAPLTMRRRKVLDLKRGGVGITTGYSVPRADGGGIA